MAAREPGQPDWGQSELRAFPLSPPPGSMGGAHPYCFQTTDRSSTLHTKVIVVSTNSFAAGPLLPSLTHRNLVLYLPCCRRIITYGELAGNTSFNFRTVPYLEILPTFCCHCNRPIPSASRVSFFKPLIPPFHFSSHFLLTTFCTFDNLRQPPPLFRGGVVPCIHTWFGLLRFQAASHYPLAHELSAPQYHESRSPSPHSVMPL